MVARAICRRARRRRALSPPQGGSPMRSRFRIAMLLVALVAMLALAPTAFAKGGGGGGGGGVGGGGGGGVCATFSSYAVTTGAFDATRASLNIDYAVAY